MNNANHRKTNGRVIALVAVALTCLPMIWLTGCGNNGGATVQPTQPKSVDEQIKIVQDDPNTPADAKPGLIEAIRQNAAHVAAAKPK